MSRVILVDPQRAAAQRFDQFALRIRRELHERDLRTVLITSALRGEGKTLTSCNLSLALASISAEHRVALVELDLRKPAASEVLMIRPQVGLERVLSGEAPLSEARIATELPSLDLFLIGRPVAKAHELLSGALLARVLAELEKRYATVVLDTPPALLVADVPLILEHVGACVAVVRAGSTRLAALHDTLEVLPPEKLLGVFLNDAPAPRHAKSYGYYAEDGKRDGNAG
jgi:capsular exopolysaccharide synthesis family protein